MAGIQATIWPSGLLPQQGGMDEAVGRAVFRRLGDPAMSNLLLLAVIPPETIREALQSARRGTRDLSHIEKAQMLLVVNAVRARHGALPVGLDDANVAGQRITQATTLPSACFVSYQD